MAGGQEGAAKQKERKEEERAGQDGRTRSSHHLSRYTYVPGMLAGGQYWRVMIVGVNFNFAIIIYIVFVLDLVSE